MKHTYKNEFREEISLTTNKLLKPNNSYHSDDDDDAFN